MSNSFESIFKPVLRIGNPIRDIGKAADKIAHETNLPVIRLHLGNPSTEQFAETKEAMVHSVMARPGGYGPHPGTDAEKEKLAHFFNDAESAPNHFCGDDAIFFPGATLITKSIMHLFSYMPTNMILLSRPGYPVYENQAYADHYQVGHYHFDENGLVDFDEIEQLILQNQDEKGETIVRLIVITYPHNPTGKALTNAEAKKIADRINKLNHRYPNIIYYNDSVYSATCATDIGYNSFYQYLSEQAQLRTITGASGAKLASMGGERIGGIATKNNLLRELLMNAQSQMTAGVSVHSIPGFLATTQLLTGQWQPGIAANSARAQIANFYQSRIAIVSEALQKIDARIVKQKPIGGMYVYADFTDLVKGKAVPETLQIAVGGKTIESGKHFRDFLLNAHQFGYHPVSTVNGEVFGESDDVIRLRISCVERNIQALYDAVNTIRAAVQTLTGDFKS